MGPIKGDYYKIGSAYFQLIVILTHVGARDVKSLDGTWLP